MKGICPVCRQSADVIESCVDTLDIHYVMQKGGAKLCPGSGGEFDEYLKAPSQCRDRGLFRMATKEAESNNIITNGKLRHAFSESFRTACSFQPRNE